MSLQVVFVPLTLTFSGGAFTPRLALAAAMCVSGVGLLEMGGMDAAGAAGASGGDASLAGLAALWPSVLALLQPPRAEPSNADERLQSLRKAGDLDSKSLFVLQTERSNGDSRVEEADARRLDHALLECASQYYKDESRRNKKAKQAAAQRATAPQLLARAHFKRAYYSEFRRGGTIPTRPTPPLQGCRRAPVALTPPDSVHARRP